MPDADSYADRKVAGLRDQRRLLHYYRFSCLCLGLLLSSGCGILVPYSKSESNLQKLALGDSRQDVVGKIGSPDSVRGTTMASPSTQVEIHEYILYPKNTAVNNFAWGFPLLTLSWWIPPPSDQRQYWLQYVNGRLSRWGRAGDWQ